MRQDATGPLPVLLGIFVSLLCVVLFAGSLYFTFRFLPEMMPQRMVIPDDLPINMEEVKADCSQGECVYGCLLRAAEWVGYEPYPPVMDTSDEYILVSYKVEGDEILDPSYQPISTKLVVYQRNSQAHQRIWDFFTKLIAPNRRPGLREFVIYSGGESGAQFSATEDGGWILRVNVLDATDPEFLTHALVHEFGHFLTLNPTQLDASQTEASCPQEPLFGCPNPDSYVNRFFVSYWTDLYPEWMGMKGATQYELLMSRFYQGHSDQFVSEYAASHPLEDIAETWTAWVLQPMPAGDSVATRKVLSFNEYPELVDTRFEIINALCNYGTP